MGKSGKAMTRFCNEIRIAGGRKVVSILYIFLMSITKPKEYRLAALPYQERTLPESHCVWLFWVIVLELTHSYQASTWLAALPRSKCCRKVEERTLDLDPWKYAGSILGCETCAQASETFLLETLHLFPEWRKVLRRGNVERSSLQRCWGPWFGA